MPVPWRFLGGLCAVRLLLYALSSGPLAYGLMSDELYYLACADRLAWGYVDHPPLSIALLAVVRSTLGDSLLALRLVPALAHGGAIVATALLARELDGGRSAQKLAGLAVLVAPVYLGMTGFYSMNAFEPLLWAAAALALARLANGADARTWLVLGLLLGLGLLNKVSTLWLGLGLVVGLLLTPERRWLATPWPWLAGALALAIFAPHLAWQVQHGWPTLEFVQNATTRKMVAKPPLTFVREQLLVMHPLLAPLWLAGLAWCFASVRRSHRLFAWIWIAPGLLLLAAGSGRANYLAPAYTPLLAAGGVAFERLARRPGLRRVPAVSFAVFALGGLGTAPLAIPLLPPDATARYARGLGIQAPVEQVGEQGVLPHHFALRLGWEELLEAVARAQATLSPEERQRAAVLGSWYGDAGAVEHFGPARGLPPAISGHNSYWLWGPGGVSGEVLLALAPSDVRLRLWYEEVERVAEVDCRTCWPDVDALAVWVCRRPRRPIAEWWAQTRRYQ